MKKILLFIAIICIAVILRFWQLGSTPPSPDWDEAALGYNAYSILNTGRDEYGNFLPFSIRSFDDYKPPLYTYLTVPSVWLFGLSVWSTRLPSAVFGVLAVVGVFFLVKELLRQRQETMSKRRDALSHADCLLSFDYLPFLSSFLLAISPWHIQFSRIAFEANTGVTINIWAVTFFLMALSRTWFLPLSAFLFGIGMYAYHSERIFLPLLLILLLVIFWKELWLRMQKKVFIISILLGLLTIIPLCLVLTDKSAMLRLRGTSSFTDKTELLSRTIGKLEDDKKNNDKIGELLDNRRFIFVKTIASGYLSHFSLKWLFLTGDNPRHHAPDMGLMYLWELPFLLIGIFFVVKNGKKAGKLLLGWFLISPVAASVTTGLPHAIRTLVFLPTFQIFTAVGVIISIEYIRKAIKSAFVRYVFYGAVGIVIVFQFCLYLGLYFVAMNKEVSDYWQYGYKEAVAYTESVKNNYEKIVVSTTLEQSYMFFLFYTKFDPAKYLALGGTKSGSFAESQNHFDIYEFRPIKWKEEKKDGSILYVGTLGELPHGNAFNVTFLNGKSAIEIASRE